MCVFSCVHVHMFVREEERARGHERQRSERRERERVNPTNKSRDVSPPACCGLPIARHLPHYSLHFTACCPLSAAFLFVHTILRPA